MINETILEECRAGKRASQRILYEYLLPKLHATCKRYLKIDNDIEDVLSEAFVHIFTKIETLREDSALVAWAKKIVVNQCLQLLRKKIDFKLSIDEVKIEPIVDAHVMNRLEQKDLLQLLQYIPDGCRAVFNLFAIEGYSHKEIASVLAISEGTSKSQLNFAKNKLQKLVNTLYYQKSTENGIAK